MSNTTTVHAMSLHKRDFSTNTSNACDQLAGQVGRMKAKEQRQAFGNMTVTGANEEVDAIPDVELVFSTASLQSAVDSGDVKHPYSMVGIITGGFNSRVIDETTRNSRS